jgi:hypothetical protein
VTKRPAMVAGLVGTCGLHALLFSILLAGPALTRTAVLNRSSGPDYLTLLVIPPGNSAAHDQEFSYIVPPKMAPRIAIPKLDPSSVPLLHIETESPEVLPAAANVLNQTAFVKTCRESYADAASFSRDLANVSLQRGAIEISGGDRDRALMALRCLQAFGTLGANTVSQSPGS